MAAAIATPLQQTLAYLKQGHATLPSSPPQIPTFNPAGNLQGTMPVSPPHPLLQLPGPRGVQNAR